MNSPRAAVFPPVLESTQALARARRAPQFVSRRTGAALLDLSVSAFDAHVRAGVLPPPAPGSAESARRWEWAQIAAYMRGDYSSAPRDLLGEPPPRAGGKRRGPKSGSGGRPKNSEMAVPR